MFQDDLIQKMVINANIKIGVIRNTFHGFEYCCTTWSPNIIMYHKEIEEKS